MIICKYCCTNMQLFLSFFFIFIIIKCIFLNALYRHKAKMNNESRMQICLETELIKRSLFYLLYFEGSQVCLLHSCLGAEGIFRRGYSVFFLAFWLFTQKEGYTSPLPHHMSKVYSEIAV